MSETTKLTNPWIYAAPVINTFSVIPNTGRWIKTIDGLYYSYYKCSECGRTIKCFENHLPRYPFCHCGAKMENAKQ